MKNEHKPPASAKAARNATTADLILDVAEALFAQQGYNGASIRDITAQAGTNLGAVTYHFGTKENLLTAILARGAAALNEERNRRLALIEQGLVAPSVESVLRAFIEPMFDLLKAPSGVQFLRIQSDVSAERTDVPREILSLHYDPCARHFMRLLATVSPHLSSDSLVWNFEFILGAVLYCLTRPRRFPDMRENESMQGWRERQLDELIRFLANAVAPHAART